MIRPLGNQLIIRTIEPGSIGSIILPDSAKGITLIGSGNPHEVEDATDYLINARLFEEILNALREDRFAAPAAKQQKWRQEVAAKLEKARSMPVPNNLANAVHFVEAEVLAVGPGKLAKDKLLLADLTEAVRRLLWDRQARIDLNSLLDRAERSVREPMSVTPGDRILFHPSVQRFDREIEPSSLGLLDDAGRCFIIREDSVLAKLEQEEAA